MAFRTLRDVPDLDGELRGQLLSHIVNSGDQTTCALTLRSISNLGEWEPKLRKILSRYDDAQSVVGTDQI
jgi:hypothetical protein